MLVTFTYVLSYLQIILDYLYVHVESIGSIYPKITFAFNCATKRPKVQ